MRYYALLNKNTTQQIVKKIQSLTATINDGAAAGN